MLFVRLLAAVGIDGVVICWVIGGCGYWFCCYLLAYWRLWVLWCSYLLGYWRLWVLVLLLFVGLLAAVVIDVVIGGVRKLDV